ncbi:hypothetical protein [Anaerospora hongkongensis]|nr:hypothetical protein [Anaerospora hongkongensis]
MIDVENNETAEEVIMDSLLDSIFDSDYKNVKPIYSIQDVKAIFPTGKANAENWLLLSTSGSNGVYTTLDDIEAGEGQGITVLIIQPRLVCIYQGHIKIEKEDITYLRKLVSSTIRAIAISQTGNVE